MEILLPYVPYNSANKDFASANRRSMTKAEKKMRFGVLSERPGGYKFIRQKMIGSFILDFYCSRLLLGIEIDGSSHNTTLVYDSIRTKKLGEHGIKIIRYQNEDVFYRLDRVAQDLFRETTIREKELVKQFELLQSNPYPPRRDPSPYQETLVTRSLPDKGGSEGGFDSSAQGCG